MKKNTIYIIAICYAIYNTVSYSMNNIYANNTNMSLYIDGKISENFIKATYEEDGFGSNKFKDNAIGGSIEIGYKLNFQNYYNSFRIGLESYHNSNMKDILNMNILNIPFSFPVEAKTKGIFLNIYYDIPVYEQLTQIAPYIGIGIGYSWLKATMDATVYGADKTTVKDKDIGYNISFGITYKINNNTNIILGYRYEDLGKIKDYEGNYNETDFNNHKILFGLRLYLI